MQLPGPLTRLRSRIAPAIFGPPGLAFLPAVVLGAFWLGGEPALMLTALGLPLVFAIAGSHARPLPGPARDAVTGLLLRDGFEAAAEQVFGACHDGALRSACFVLELDDYRDHVARHGQEAGDTLAQRSGERILSALRDGDKLARLGDSRFAVCLAPVRQMDLELAIRLAGRIQGVVEEPVQVDGVMLYLSCSIGFCLRSRAPGRTGQDWIAAASTALADAQQNGASSIRAYSADIQRRTKTRLDLREDASTALESGQIHAWFQPQISTDTGKVTGFEALARWNHPDHGVIAAADFLPVMEEAGLMDRLGQLILYHALTALKAWDNAGMEVPRIAVNFALGELRNTGLVDKIRWELDRFDLTPDRLCVEIMESVVADFPDETVTRNIRGLDALGCSIDLDDFGTGHASLPSIRRFNIARLKIGRAFITKADQDTEQQRMVAAILTMAERLEVETIAEGVETVGEHALLAQLGCGHVQGFGIGRPMPFDQTLDWIARHEAKLADAPRIGRDVN